MRLSGRRASVLIPIVLCLVFVLAPLTVHATAKVSQVRVVPTEVCACAPASQTAAASKFIGRGPPFSGNYDEQLGMTFTQSFTSIEYNVTAVEQTDPVLGDGPAYLVNGLSNSGYWYQVGVSWNWAPGSVPGTGFDMNYEVFDSSGNSVFPADGQGGVSAFSGPVNAGDNILLDLYFSSGAQSVTMLAEDTDTKAVASQTYSSMASTYFVGLPSSVANSNGYFTGLMTEWYHGEPYYANEAEVVYSDPRSALTSAWMWMDEFDANTLTAVFSSNTSAPVSYSDPTRLQEFSFNGTTEYSDAFHFVTGSLTNGTISNGTPLILSYAVSGGGVGYSPPTLTYVSEKAPHTVPLTQSPTVYYADPGSSWNVSLSLGGSTALHRWQTDQATSGSANSSLATQFTYYSQYAVTFGFSVEGGGSGYAAPSVSYVTFGGTSRTPVGVSVWADASSGYQYSSPLPGSNGDERWSTLSTGSVARSGQISAVYYRQYLVTFEVAFKDTEIFPALSLSSTAEGQSYSATVSEGPNAEWLDYGAAYSVTRSYSLESGQRLLTDGMSTGQVSTNATVTLVYLHQFYVEVTSNDTAGGTVSPSSGWYDSGSTLNLAASPSQGWTTEGWVGAGSDSVSASTATVSLTVGPGTPANETAVFYPGVSIRTEGPSAVSYSDGLASGTVAAGTTEVVYVPPSSILKVIGSSIPLFTQFEGWKGASNATGTSTSFVVEAPGVITSESGYDYLGIGAFALVVVLIAVASAWLARRQLTSRARPPADEAASTSISSIDSFTTGFHGGIAPRSRAVR
jgi:hypothetical protein